MTYWKTEALVSQNSNAGSVTCGKKKTIPLTIIKLCTVACNRMVNAETNKFPQLFITQTESEDDEMKVKIPVCNGIALKDLHGFQRLSI